MNDKAPRTDSMLLAVKGFKDTARARNLAFLCRKLELQLRRVGHALDHQNEVWGLYGNESQNTLKAFKKTNQPTP